MMIAHERDVRCDFLLVAFCLIFKFDLRIERGGVMASKRVSEVE